MQSRLCVSELLAFHITIHNTNIEWSAFKVGVTIELPSPMFVFACVLIRAIECNQYGTQFTRDNQTTLTMLNLTNTRIRLHVCLNHSTQNQTHTHIRLRAFPNMFNSNESLVCCAQSSPITLVSELSGNLFLSKTPSEESGGSPVPPLTPHEGGFMMAG